MSNADTSRVAHTPGPWKAECFLVSQVGGRRLEVCHTGLVGRNKPGEQAIADARLIAAAPEMFAAIQGALRIADLWRPSEDWPEGWEEARALSAMFSAFEEIVRKVDLGNQP